LAPQFATWREKTAPKMQFYHGTFVRSSISTFPPRNSQSPQ
jgi:hypothetical protein